MPPSMNQRRVFKSKAELISYTVAAGDTVLDVGFCGQGITHGDPSWPHTLLKQAGADVYGLDLVIDRTAFPDANRYHESSAESFEFPDVRFDVIFAGDIIEHLPNPGLFLERCRAHLKSGGKLVLTTPNAFNFFSFTEKLMKDEPTVNEDHTMYFNHKTLRVLLNKCSFSISEIHYVYSLGYSYKESWKKKLLNVLYRVCSLVAPKLMETLVVIAVPQV